MIVETIKLKPSIMGGLEEKSSQRRKVYDKECVSPTLQAAMGMGGGCVPFIVEEIKIEGSADMSEIADASMLRMVRTEEGKKLRKAYEAGEIHHGFNEHRTAEPRTDGVSNCITTVQKDNMLVECKVVAQRGRYTEDGSIEQRLEVADGDHSNTITTVQKDNMLLETYQVKQATKQGYIECAIGGGRSELSEKPNTKGQGNTERKCVSHPTDREYP